MMDDSIGNQYATKLSANHAASASYVASSTIGITSNNVNNSKIKSEINYKHLINFNQLAEKLRKIQKTNQSVGSPSVKCKKSHDTSQQIQNSSSYNNNTTNNSNVKKQQLIYPRSISTFDNNRNLIKQKVNKKYSYNSIDRQAQYSSSRNLKSEHGANTASVYMLQQNQAQQMQQPQSIESNKSNKKHKSDLSFHSSFSSSSLSSFESESFEMSCSNSSSRCSSANSFYGDKKSINHTKSVISCNNVNNIASNSLRSKHGISINNVDTISNINTSNNSSNNNNNNANSAPAKQIVIRRERSIGYMQSQVQCPLSCTNINKPSIQASSSSFNTLYFNSNSTNMCGAPPTEEPTNTVRVGRSRPIKKTQKSSSSSSNNEESKLKQNKINNTSSTTSGIESNSKNSNYENEATNREVKSDVVDTYTTESISSSFELNELKNRLFIAEADLSNERKKLNQEKDLKKFIQFELKSRYEAEKAAALKALEAKLNAEKLLELNKLKEMYEQQKRDEFDAKQKVLENQILNLKFKLREKSEKYSNLEKQLKEEQSKNNQLFSKSVEMTQKYNQELKNKKETNQQQLNESNELIKKRLVQIYMNLSSQNIPLTKFDSDLNALLIQLESLSKYVTKALNDTKLEANSLREQLDKLTIDYSNCNEQKHKLEALYKVKCKSDLNKSAQIKKCQLNYDLELMKFRNEFNYDLVRHLENQISIKDAELLELNSKLDSITNLIANHSSYESSSSNSNQKDIIKSLNNIINLAANEAFKKVPLNVLYSKEIDSSNKKFLV